MGTNQSTFLTAACPLRAHLFLHYTDEEFSFHFIFFRILDGTSSQGPAVQLVISQKLTFDSFICNPCNIRAKIVQRLSSKSMLLCFQLSCAYISYYGNNMPRKYKYLSRICIQFWPTHP